MKPKTLAALTVLAAFTGLLFLNFGQQVGGYMTFAEAAETGRTAHVVGTWAEGRATRYDRARNVFSFYMRDEKGSIQRVRYPGTKPANFEEAQKVVVEGEMPAAGGSFEAEHILVKCPSKYNETRIDTTASSS